MICEYSNKWEMSFMKVVKFGGSSLSSGSQLKKVLDIVKEDAERKLIVVSAPGSRNADDVKVTDLLIGCGEEQLAGRKAEAEAVLEKAVDRYAAIVEELALPPKLVSEIRSHFLGLLHADHLNPIRYLDALKAAGEDQNARLVAAFFQAEGMNARYMSPREAGLILTDEHGYAEVLPETYGRLGELRYQDGILVFPGFFGYSKTGEVITFSRSGSDITGSILANGTKADVYENFTDVDAVYAVNPQMVKNPEPIRELTYREMRELSYAGFSVFHDQALIPAYRAGIPVHIKNTNNPGAPGTKIVSASPMRKSPVVGIASDAGFCSIYVSKYLMNREVGFGRRLLQILEDHYVSYEHIPSGIDDVTIILRQYQLDPEKENRITKRIRTELQADEVKIEHDLALIMIAGEGMRHNVGTTARASKALAGASVNIEMISQGSSEVSMVFGVKSRDETKAVRALYEEFFTKVAVPVS